MQNKQIQSIFISLNFFILIFFILLISYISVSQKNYNLNSIFPRYHSNNKIIVNFNEISNAEQRLLQARKYFKRQLSTLLSDHSLRYSELLSHNKLFNIQINQQEIHNIDSLENIRAFFKKISNIVEYNNGHRIVTDVIIGTKATLSDGEVTINLDKIVKNIASIIDIPTLIPHNFIIDKIEFNDKLGNDYFYVEIKLQ